MNQNILPNSVFTAGSWALLAAAMVALAAVGIEVFQRHIADPPVQQFNFGSLKRQDADERVSLAGIINAHIFGTVPVVTQPSKPKVVEAPKTKLNLSLTGVITSPDPNQGRAMIEIQRGQTSVVLVGNEIGNTGAKLDAVFADHILIQHRGALEKLVIERDSLKLDDLTATNAQTISALNINVAEFEALAEVDPEDLDISKLIPANPAPPTEADDPDEAAEQEEEAERLEEERKRIEQAERLRQQQQMQAEQDALEQQQQIQQLQPDPGGAAEGLRQLPEGLKQI
jgi:hypothetical protein